MTVPMSEKSVTSTDELNKTLMTEEPPTAPSALNAYASDKAPYPKSVLFIVGNEFCERFCFYGMKAILPLYLTAFLGLRETSATEIIHLFNFSAYFFAVFGGILSDNFIGKFKTILYLSVVYCIGNVFMSGTAIPGVTGVPPHWWGTGISLLLIAVGTGGIKPCVASFGGDQFALGQTRQLSVFFSIFYLAINVGSMLSMFLTPLLRRVSCLGQDSCYPLAFGVPAVLMLMALILFLCGYPFYRKEPVRSSVVAHFFILLGVSSYRKTKALFKRQNSPWLLNCSDKYSETFITDAKTLLRLLKVFLPICLFWALYDQQGSWWVYQANMMESQVNFLGWKFSIMPEQMGLSNAFLILIFVPIASHGIYKIAPMKALTRMGTGMVLLAISFIMAASLQFIVGSRGTFAPSPTNPEILMCTAGCVNILWQLPQYFVLTWAETFLSVTGLEFSYSQAPESMKSVCNAGWLLTVAGGNLAVLLVTLINPVRWFRPSNPMAWNFVAWGGIMILGTIGYFVTCSGFKYKEEQPMFAIVTSPLGHKEEGRKPLTEGNT